MAKKTRNKTGTDTNGGPLGYEERLWKMADALRNNLDAAEYKHVVLGLLFGWPSRKPGRHSRAGLLQRRPAQICRVSGRP